MVKINHQNRQEYTATALKNGIVPYRDRDIWFKLLYALTGINFPRGYSDNVIAEVWIDDGAFYISGRDKDLLIRHELGHIEGKEHTTFGLMCPYGLLRFLTA